MAMVWVTVYSDKLCKMIDEVRSGNGVSDCV